MTPPLHWKVVADAADPHAQAEFWAATLGYLVEDNSTLIEGLLAHSHASDADVVTVRGRRAWRDLVAVRHPDDPHDERTGTGLGRRILFQRVPEPKTGKNRLHLDVHAAPGTRDAEAERLTALGATVLRRVREPGGEWIVMADPEGGEFCLH
ncbi:VOC family protein [Streptomyces sp. NPDC096310]|uniref:VOC family protein n=1 Tax=Streptomyces sp. NPDC096310 TaxID=3366082 RepID=UPI00382AD070